INLYQITLLYQLLIMIILKKICTVSIILLISFYNLYSALPQVQKNNISDENRENLEKVEELNSEAKEIDKEAEEYYKKIEIVDPEGEAAFDSKIEKKVNKLKNKAFDKQIEALELKNEANKLEYQVYKNLILNYLNTVEPNSNKALDLKLLEEQAKEYFYRAEMIQESAYDYKNDYENMFKRLSEAQEFEKLGLTKENQAYKLIEPEATEKNTKEKEIITEENYATETDEVNTQDEIVPDTIPDSIDSSENIEVATDNIVEEKTIEDVEIDERILKDYMDYLTSSGETDTKSIIQSLNELNNFNSENLRKIWYNYLYESNVIPDEIKTALADSVSAIEAKMLAEKIAKEEANQEEESKEQARVDSVYENNAKEELAEKPKEDKNLLFRIEIATDKQTISQGALQKIYNGEKTVNIINEGEWQKYSISAFNTYAQAEKFRGEIPVKDAFIVSYKKTGEANEIADVQNKAIEEEYTEESYEPKEEFSAKSNLIFKVQIAASKTPIPDRILNQIYKGGYDIDLIVEDGWYKYSIGTYKEYQPAVNIRKNVGVKGAFVVAYSKGEKVSLDVARGKSIPMYSKISKDEGDFPITKQVIYKVQIAASKNVLSKSFLSELYPGDNKVHIIHEEGWFRYSIGEYNNINNASDARMQFGIEGAFVVSYQNGKKVNLFSAKKLANEYFEPKLISDWTNSGNNIVFKVQIAASIEKIAIPDLKNIFCLNENVYVIKEGVWYKYLIGKYSSFTEASEIRKKACVKGAFVVAYKNDNKLSINEAIGK
ncbi:MAG: hypothetical protein PF487_11260, partial [Bacteroidales bacterium]|nr:hypothetical protein [Bacteroidales bacterium]